MGFFGGTARQEPVTSPSYEEETFEDAFDSLPPLPKPQDNTIIAKGVTFTGTIEGEGIVQIEGRLEGEVKLKGSVTVATTGVVKGPIHGPGPPVLGTHRQHPRRCIHLLPGGGEWPPGWQQQDAGPPGAALCARAPRAPGRER